MRNFIYDVKKAVKNFTFKSEISKYVQKLNKK